MENDVHISFNSNIVKTIQKYQWVSFDVFDTLIKRTVNAPTDIFRLVEKKYNAYNSPVEGYYNNRIQAEKEAREKCSCEVTVDDIYTILEKKYNRPQLELLRKIELETEIELCVPNQEILNLFKIIIKAGKKVCIISDMYLPQSIIKAMLSKCGYDIEIPIYVSCEYGATKNEGTLYKIVLDKLKIPAQELIHVGDNKHSDYKVPKSLGINAIHIPTEIDYLRGNAKLGGSFEEEILRAFTNNTLPLNMDYPYRLGYQTFGPLLYGFCRWLQYNIQKEGITKILFFSRDGQLMKKAYDLMYPAGTDNCYFFASRKALLIPTLLHKRNIEEVVNSMYLPPQISIQEFFSKLDIDLSNYKDKICENNISIDKLVAPQNIHMDNDVRFVYSLIERELIEKSKRQNGLFNRYLEQVQIPDRVAIVDIGWYGHMQQAFEELIGLYEKEKTPTVFGYYFGLTPRSEIAKSHSDHMRGFLFSPDRNLEIYKRIVEVINLFEALFIAGHGTVKAYKDNNGFVTPVFGEYEYNKLKKEENAILSYQKGALAWIEAFQKQYGDLIDVTDLSCSKMFLDMCINPSAEEAELFGNIPFFDNITRKIAAPNAKRFYLVHPKLFVRDFLKSSWRIGFLKRINLFPRNFGETYISIKWRLRRE